jgi:hypothetical protein
MLDMNNDQSGAKAMKECASLFLYSDLPIWLAIYQMKSKRYLYSSLSLINEVDHSFGCRAIPRQIGLPCYFFEKKATRLASKGNSALISDISPSFPKKKMSLSLL